MLLPPPPKGREFIASIPPAATQSCFLLAADIVLWSPTLEDRPVKGNQGHMVSHEALDLTGHTEASRHAGVKHLHCERPMPRRL